MAGDKLRRKSKREEARIIDSLSQKPKTVEQLAAALGKCPSGVSAYLKRLRAANRVYVSGHEPRTGSPAQVWSVGSGPDVEYVPQEIPMPKISAQERRDTVLRLLKEESRTIRALAAAMHVVYETAGRYVRQLRKPSNRQIRISAWRHPRDISPDSGYGGDWTPVYAIGALPDEPKPPRETSKERHARMHKSKAYRDARNEARRERYKTQRMIKKHTQAGPQPWFAALPGAQAAAKKPA